MKKILLLLMITMIYTLSACKPAYEKVPLIIYNEEDPYIKEFEQRIILNSNGLFDIESFDSQNSQLIQNEIINDLFEKEPKVLIINPVDRLGAYTIIEKAKLESIPVIFFNREPLKEDLAVWNNAFYVGALDEESAIIQSEMVIELFGHPANLSEHDKNDDGKIQLVILKGEQGHQAAEKRTTVIIQELEQYGYNLEILTIEVCDWNRDIANQFMKDFVIDLNVEIELVISNNDNMALGAIDALIESDFMIDLNDDGKYDSANDIWIPVLGIDALEEAIPYIENGTLYGTVINDSEVMAEAIVELAKAIINGEDVNDIKFKIEDNSYIWVPYKRYYPN